MAQLFLNIEFDNDLEDVVYDANGDPLIPGGRPLAERVAEFLRSRGLDVSSVAQRDYYGWDFRWKDGRNFITAVLQPAAGVHRWLILVSDTSWVSLLFPKMTRESVRKAGLMVKDALESTGIGKNLLAVEQDARGRRRR